VPQVIREALLSIRLVESLLKMTMALADTCLMFIYSEGWSMCSWTSYESSLTYWQHRAACATLIVVVAVAIIQATSSKFRRYWGATLTITSLR
jgi:hypothetical protein